MLSRRPVEPGLVVADVLDRLAGQLVDLVEHRLRTAHLARDHDPVGGRQRLAGDARFRHRGDVGIDDRIGDPVADLVGMTFGDGLAGEEIIARDATSTPLGKL